VKLINYLLSESKKGWKWPSHVVKAVVMEGDRGVNFYFDYTCPPSLSETLISPHPFTSAEVVTSQQYEAALAASKPEWNGDGVPPVGTECEYSLNAGRTWFKCKIDYVLGTQGLIMLADVYEGGQFVGFAEYDGKLKFRPIRSEADKKKEEAVFAIAELCRQSASNGHSAELIYDAIKSGKIIID
ncbi:hypothetical protein ACM7TL_17215, partial [Enterobacter hormaechei]